MALDASSLHTPAFSPASSPLPFSPLPWLDSKLGRRSKLPDDRRPKETLLVYGGISLEDVDRVITSSLVRTAAAQVKDNGRAQVKDHGRTAMPTKEYSRTVTQWKDNRPCPQCSASMTEEWMACSKASVLDSVNKYDTDEEGGSPSWAKLATHLGEAGGLLGSSAPELIGQQGWNLTWFSNSEDFVDVKLLGTHLESSAAVQSSPPPRQKQEDPEKQDYYVNIGYAIRTLRDELPTMFYKEMTHDIYRKDIVFRDPMNMVSGLNNYKLIFRALRFHGRIFFKALWVDILRIWQPSENVIMVRWQVRGIPRVPWEAQGIFDGTSEYKLDKRGKIYEHKVDNVALNARPKFKVPTVAELLRVGTCPTTPRPTFFQKSQAVLLLLLPYLLQFTWVRYYLALKGTVGLNQDPHLL